MSHIYLEWYAVHYNNNATLFHISLIRVTPSIVLDTECIAGERSGFLPVYTGSSLTGKRPGTRPGIIPEYGISRPSIYRVSSNIGLFPIRYSIYGFTGPREPGSFGTLFAPFKSNDSVQCSVPMCLLFFILIMLPLTYIQSYV